MSILLANNKSQAIPTTTLVHGDSTPWNTHLSTSAVLIYDLELAQQLLILNGFLFMSDYLYDCFHHLFQTNLLVHRKSFQEIKKAIDHLGMT